MCHLSPSTRLRLPRYWTATHSNGSAGTDAFAQSVFWGAGAGVERIWAHPPPNLLMPLVQLLAKPERTAEVIVCAPAFQSQNWFQPMLQLSSDRWKCNAGKLQKVAPDAPSRVPEWPIMLFHIRAREGEVYAKAAERRLAAAATIRKHVKGHQAKKPRGTTEPNPEQEHAPATHLKAHAVVVPLLSLS